MKRMEQREMILLITEHGTNKITLMKNIVRLNEILLQIQLKDQIVRLNFYKITYTISNQPTNKNPKHNENQKTPK